MIGIDASNIRTGGGVTHLSELLNAASPERHGFHSILIFAPQSTLDTILSKPWIIKKNSPDISKGILYRIYWQRFVLARLVKDAGCHILFVPGGVDVSGFNPVVTMSQNLLPFDWQQIFRYGLTLFTFKLILLRFVQSKTFRKSTGVVFLTNFARNEVLRVVKRVSGKIAIIPHGIDPRFLMPPRIQLGIEGYTIQKPFTIIYVSTIDLYKNQWNVAEAVAKLRDTGLPIELNLIGSSRSSAMTKLRDCLNRTDPDGEFIKYIGPVAFSDLHNYYANADLMVFASSCENMPNILLEGMAAGLPIICSNRGPMSEILGDSGLYFDPENIDEISLTMRRMINSITLRTALSKASFEKSKHFSWEHSADLTFNFISSVYSESN